MIKIKKEYFVTIILAHHMSIIPPQQYELDRFTELDFIVRNATEKFKSQIIKPRDIIKSITEKLEIAINKFNNDKDRPMYLWFDGIDIIDFGNPDDIEEKLDIYEGLLHRLNYEIENGHLPEDVKMVLVHICSIIKETPICIIDSEEYI